MLAAATVVAAFAVDWRDEAAPVPPPATTAAEPAPEPAPEPPPPAQGIPAVAPPWRGAGAFVWHETDVSPEELAVAMREEGFAWVAVHLHEGLSDDPIEDDWVGRFRAAGGPPVGGWGVLRDEPEREAALVAELLRRNGLGFYVANAEAEYGSTGDPARSRRFVAAFRGALPDVPAALSAPCHRDAAFDLAAWRDGGFVLLPQAYVNQFGAGVAPSACVTAAAPVYPPSSVHPTVGTYVASHEVAPARYARLLDDAGTVGFSIYLAETEMPAEAWAAFGREIDERGIASRAR